MQDNLTLAAAFIAGVSGSMHCMVMCGGIASAFGMRARTLGGSAPLAFLHASVYQLGRLSSYALAGILCGWFGGAVQGMMELVHLTLLLRVFAGLLLIALGLQLMLRWRLLQPLEKLGATVWRQVSPLTQYTGQGLLQALALGALWGWLPCGLVYSMLLLGVLGGGALHGATIMLAFGLGTLPAMLSSSLLTAQLTRITAQKSLRFVAGLLLLLLGMWTMGSALLHSNLFHMSGHHLIT
jgi:sulfite exporter TauE/SafE